MNDETTPSETLDTQASDSSHPQDQLNDEAAQSSDNTSQSSETESNEPESSDTSIDPEIKEWAEKKGVQLDDPIALAKLARNAEKNFHDKSTEASALKKAVGSQAAESADSAIEQEAFPIINRLRVAEFYQDHPDAVQYDAQMAEIVDQKPWLGQDLESLYLIAKAQSTATEALQARQEGRKEALNSVAQAQRAGAPKAAPTGKPAPAKRYTSADIDKMTPQEYMTLKASGFNPYTDVVD